MIVVKEILLQITILMNSCIFGRMQIGFSFLDNENLGSIMPGNY
jgi:hypothetical protein